MQLCDWSVLHLVIDRSSVMRAAGQQDRTTGVCVHVCVVVLHTCFPPPQVCAFEQYESPPEAPPLPHGLHLPLPVLQGLLSTETQKPRLKLTSVSGGDCVTPRHGYRETTWRQEEL